MKIVKKVKEVFASMWVALIGFLTKGFSSSEELYGPPQKLYGSPQMLYGSMQPPEELSLRKKILRVLKILIIPIILIIGLVILIKNLVVK